MYCIPEAPDFPLLDTLIVNLDPWNNPAVLWVRLITTPSRLCGPDSLEDLQHYCKRKEPTFRGFSAEVPLSDGHEDGRWTNCLEFKVRIPMKSFHEQNIIPKYNEGKERCGDQIKSSTQSRKLVSIPCEKSHMHILCENKNKSTSVPLYAEM